MNPIRAQMIYGAVREAKRVSERCRFKERGE
jgi:hypothetical protein